MDEFEKNLKIFLCSLEDPENLFNVNFTEKEKNKIKVLKNVKKNKSLGNIRKNSFKNF